MTTVHVRRDERTLTNAGAWVAVAECAPGETLVAGGAGLLAPSDVMESNPRASLIASYPATTFVNAAKPGETASRWVVGAVATAASATRLAAWALCTAKPS